MLFNSPLFAFFFFAVLLGYQSLRGTTARKWLLLVASYLFYAGWDYRYLPLLFGATFVDYVAAGAIHRAESAGRRRTWLLASLAANLGILGVFKYGNFGLDTLEPLWHLLEIEPPRLPLQIPLGISFYTFQALSYTIDVYRRQMEPARNLLDYAVYISFFAHLVAGPIVRAPELLPQLDALGDVRAGNLYAGMQRFLIGLFKKVVIADNVGLFVDAVFEAPGDHAALTLWCAAYAFGLQIYCDFSGYSDMAIGIARVFGLRFPENFRFPLLATSLTEFWKRWHITLSSWLRDYLYVSLGGARPSRGRSYANLLLTMLLAGLWHGAAWTFVIWGGFHGVLLAVERVLGVGWGPEPLAARSVRSVVRAIFTFQLVSVGWVFFRCESFPSMAVYLQRMFTEWSWIDAGAEIGLFWSVITIVFVTGEYVLHEHLPFEPTWNRLSPALQGLGLALLIMIIAYLHVERTAFIYFQF